MPCLMDSPYRPLWPMHDECLYMDEGQHSFHAWNPYLGPGFDLHTTAQCQRYYSAKRLEQSPPNEAECECQSMQWPLHLLPEHLIASNQSLVSGTRDAAHAALPCPPIFCPLACLGPA